jgi:hypothetical protein
VSAPDEKAARPPHSDAEAAVESTPAGTRRSGSLIEWLIEQGLLRGPHLFVDYWASVLRLGGMIPEAQIRAGLVDPPLFRAGLDRPDFQIPRLRFYLLLFVVGPLVLPFRSFRRLGRYRLRFLGRLGREIQDALARYWLDLTRAAPGRVHASLGTTPLARDILDPHLVAGFCSLFWAAYKLPLASFSAILLVAVATPAFYAAGLLGVVADFWMPVGFPLIVVLLYAVYREWVTAILGALPVAVGRYLLRFAQPSSVEGWLAFVWPLLGLFALYLLFDWFFMPRPVPPVLLLYTADGPGSPYEREGDAPHWLEGRVYWVWRYLVLSPAELNKFWERDWERVDLWIRADGDDAGKLEWVVTDLHYRELWVPYERLGPAHGLARHARHARESIESGEPGTWVVEVDADLLVHYPFIRGVAFLPERGGVPVRGALDLVSALWTRVRDEPAAAQLAALDRARLRIGRDVLADVPEFLLRRVSRHLMSQPWRFWRYPLGAASRQEPRLYGRDFPDEPPPAADPALQIRSGRAPTDG